MAADVAIDEPAENVLDAFAVAKLLDHTIERQCEFASDTFAVLSARNLQETHVVKSRSMAKRQRRPSNGTVGTALKVACWLSRAPPRQHWGDHRLLGFSYIPFA
jgi:hypothetical protein